MDEKETKNTTMQLPPEMAMQCNQVIQQLKDFNRKKQQNYKT